MRREALGKNKETDQPNGTARNWSWTINNPTATPEEILGFLAGTYFSIFQREKGENGTEHYQGYSRFKAPVRLSALKKLGVDFGRAHFEIAKGNEQQNIAYCTKQDSHLAGPWELGERSQQGKRTDLDDVAADVKSGHSLKRIAEDHPSAFIKYHRGITELRNTLRAPEPRDFLTELWVFYGTPGTGKSYAANTIGRELGMYSPVFGNSGLWWDGYDGQHVIVLDEFKCQIPLAHLKRMADRYEYKVDVKGLTAVQFTSKIIIITTNIEFDFWYISDKVSNTERDALRRRIQFMARFDSLDGPIVVDWDDRAQKTVIPRPEK